MPGVNAFTKLTSVEDALEIFLEYVLPVERKSMVDLDYADNRVLASDIVAPKDFPHYDRCFMDGYAAVAADTAGASRGAPVSLKLVDGEVVGAGQCKLVHTGSAMPEGADAVVKVEDTEETDGDVQVFQAAARGQYFTPAGSVIKNGEKVFLSGRQLKPTDIAMLATLGLAEAEVYERPKVLVIPTGDELIERGKIAGPGRINESNGLMCYLYVRRYGGKASAWDIVPDDVEKLKEALLAGVKYDLIVTSGGTSVGRRDHMHELVSSMGQVLVHGVGLKPGKPAGMGYIEQDGKRTPIVFLPGFPDACAVGAMVLVSRAIKKLGHYPPAIYPERKAVLSDKITTFPGTMAIKKVRVEGDKATPVDTVGPSPYEGDYAYVILRESSSGCEKGDEVESVYLE